MAMIFRELDLQQKVEGDPKNPSADLMFHVTGIHPQDETLDDVIARACVTIPGQRNVPQYVTFRVPNNFGEALDIYPKTLFTKLYLRSVHPAWLAPDQATVLVKYGMHDAAPDVTQGGERKDKSEEDGEVLGPEYSFDTQGGTQHITQSIFTRSRRNANGGIVDSAPNHSGAIGVSRDKVEGCDIVTGTLKLSVTLKGVPVSHDYLRKLKAMTGKINDRDFYKRKAEEMLLLGASGSYRPGDGWVVTYSFHEAENVDTEQDLGDVKFASIKGHDYVWFRYKEAVDGAFTIQIPESGYCEQVYRKTDMRQLFMAGAYNPTLPADPTP